MNPPGAAAGAPTVKDVTGSAEVLVVGAGPTGLTLAAQLASHGISPRIIDRGRQLDECDHVV